MGTSTVPAERLRAERPDHVWAIDFQFDQTADGHNLKLLHVVDEFTREALAIECRRRIDADHTVKVLDRLWENLFDLPAVDLSLHAKLPDLIGPDLQRLREAIAEDDPDWGWDALTAVTKQIDTPQQRVKLADALIQLRDQHRINRRQAAYAIFDLNSHSTRFIVASVIEAVAVSVGASRTPGGLHIAA